MKNEIISKKLEQINNDEYQKTAYESPGNTVVLAGPGSGKTTVLTLKMMKLLQEEIPEPLGLACLTFSREAAREFTDRLRSLGYIKTKNVFLGTVHSFCLKEIIGRFAKMYDIGIPMPIKIISEKEKASLIAKAAELTGIESYASMDASRLLGVSGKSEIDIQVDQKMVVLAEQYEKLLYSKGLIDYEAIIIESTKMLQKYPYISECLSARYPWILIDEYQDLGRPLHEMVISLVENSAIRFFAVGDPDQSIYGFQGAVPDYLIELSNRSDVDKISLINNYRSNQDIIDGFELMLSKSRGYIAELRKNEEAIYEFISLDSEMDDQYDFFVNSVFPKCQKEGIPSEEIAVLLGNNEECKCLAEKCKAAGIPYYIVKHSFDRSDFVKWVELCAMWVMGDADSVFSDLYDYWKELLYVKAPDWFLSADDDMIERKKLLYSLEASRQYIHSAQEWFEFIRRDLKFDEVLADNDFLPDEIDNLDKLYLELSGNEYKSYGVEKFCKIGKPENQVVISTRHSSKGLEFEVVVMMGMEDNRFPLWHTKKDKRKLEESDRLCFVCISRAKRVCILMKSQYHTMKGKNGPWRKPYSASKYWTALYEKYANKAKWFS